MRAAALLALLFASCEPVHPPFVCSDDPSCTLNGVLGHCLPSDDGKKYCAFADPSCPNSFKWHDSAAPDLAGKCTPTATTDGGIDASMPDQSVPPDMRQVDLAHALTWDQFHDGIGHLLFGVWGSSADDVYVVGEAGTIMHSTDHGMTWPITTVGTKDYYAVWGTGPTDIYVVGDAGTVVHWGGASWSPLNSGTTADLRGVAGSSATVEVVGRGGAIQRSSNGGQFLSALGTPTSDLSGIWSDGMGTMVAVASGGVIVRSANDGVSFAPQSSGVTYDFSSVWGRNGSDVFAVGGTGGILHFDGTNWSPQVSNSGDLMFGLAGAGGDFYATGWQGTILHTGDDGTTWASQLSGTSFSLIHAWAAAGDDVYISAGGGLILHGH